MRRMSFGDMNATASGSIWSSTLERRVIEPVCQCSSTRPVESTIGYSSSGNSSGGMTCAGTILPRPLCGREAGGEDDLVAGLVGIVDRIGHRAFALQPIPGDVLAATA